MLWSGCQHLGCQAHILRRRWQHSAGSGLRQRSTASLPETGQTLAAALVHLLKRFRQHTKAQVRASSARGTARRFTTFPPQGLRLPLWSRSNTILLRTVQRPASTHGWLVRPPCSQAAVSPAWAGCSSFTGGDRQCGESGKCLPSQAEICQISRPFWARLCRSKVHAGGQLKRQSMRSCWAPDPACFHRASRSSASAPMDPTWCRFFAVKIWNASARPHRPRAQEMAEEAAGRRGPGPDGPPSCLRPAASARPIRQGC